MFPAIAVIGVGFALLQRRYEPGEESFATTRIVQTGRVVLLGYEAFLFVMWCRVANWRALMPRRIPPRAAVSARRSH